MTRALLIGMLSAGWVLTAIAQPRYVDGVFVHANSAPIELLTFADRTSIGQLRMSSGSFEDVPVVESVNRVLCSLPNWQPAAVWVSTKRIFRDEYAERRHLPFAVRRLNIYAIELRVADAESPESVSRLMAAVRASEENPALLFITMASGHITRDYIVQLTASLPH